MVVTVVGDAAIVNYTNLFTDTGHVLNYTVTYSDARDLPDLITVEGLLTMYAQVWLIQNAQVDL